MFCGIVLGGLGALALFKVVRHHRRWHGGGGWRHRGHGRWRGGHRMGAWWMMRELDLDRAQRQELFALADDVRSSFRSFRWDGIDDLRAAADVITADDFDRTRLEELAARRETALGDVRRKLVDALERAHQVLRPEQRAKLRDLVARFGSRFGFGGGGPAPSSGGPYRTATTM